MEVSEVRRQLRHAIERAKARAQRKRQNAADAERAYAAFLEDVATPTTRMVANALKAEGYPFTVFTPSGSVRLMSDRNADDYIEVVLDTTGDEPQVIGRSSRGRGHRVLQSEQPIRDAKVGDLTEHDVLGFVMKELEPLVER